LEGETELRKIPKQEYTAEFRRLAVKRMKAGQTAGAVAKELGLVEQMLRNWVKAFDAGKLNGPDTKQFKATTDSKHSLPVAPNLLDKEFSPVVPNPVWTADLTYI